MGSTSVTTGGAPSNSIMGGPSSSSSSRKQGNPSILLFHPAVHVCVGVIQIIGCIVGMLMQVQTSESWFLNITGVNVFKINFNLFLQWGSFFSGGMNGFQGAAFCFAWGSQIIFLSLKIGVARARAHNLQRYATGVITDEMLKSAQRREAGWNLLAWGILLMNEYTDFIYVGNLGLAQQLFFMAVMFALAFYGGTNGLQNVIAGLQRMGS